MYTASLFTVQLVSLVLCSESVMTNWTDKANKLRYP